jgi:hypothetical protein
MTLGCSALLFAGTKFEEWRERVLRRRREARRVKNEVPEKPEPPPEPECELLFEHKLSKFNPMKDGESHAPITGANRIRLYRNYAPHLARMEVLLESWPKGIPLPAHDLQAIGDGFLRAAKKLEEEPYR